MIAGAGGRPLEIREVNRPLVEGREVTRPADRHLPPLELRGTVRIMAERGGVNLLGLLYLALVLAVMFGPMLLSRGPASRGPSDPDSDGGSGDGPPQPQPPGGGPANRTPLDDAEPARFRLRDHVRPADRQPAPRPQAISGAEPDPHPHPGPVANERVSVCRSPGWRACRLRVCRLGRRCAVVVKRHLNQPVTGSGGSSSTPPPEARSRGSAC